MKKFMTLLAIVAGMAVLAPVTSQARDYHRQHSHNCGSCGSGVYRERVLIGYDCHGHPQYTWRTVGHSCRSSHGHGHGHDHSRYHGRHQGHGHHHSGSRGHISLPGFSFSFGRR